MPLLIALVYFVAEGWFLFWLAGRIGLIEVFLLLGASALLGFYLVRSHGMHSFARANQALMQGLSPREEVLDGIVLLLCGLILIVPGLLSDILALPLLLPALRRAVVRRMGMRLASRPGFPAGGYGGGGNRPEDGSGFDCAGQSFRSMGGRQGPFVFYRFFTSGPVAPPNNGYRMADYERNNRAASSEEYKVIVHDDKVIDVTPEQPENDDLQKRGS
ncbi:MAG: FxsA family protein [Desulfovibrionaceae bacterium]|nr:FxsA family protein [Desulfovibrionaceae bacterium]